MLVQLDTPFKLIDEKVGFKFYQKVDGKQKRYLVTTSTKELLSPDEYNAQIIELAPDALKKSPAFEKNTDLLILLDIIGSSTNDFKKHEKEIFLIEENPFYFKKYVLYTAEEERALLNQIKFSDFLELIKDREKFNEYKSAPYKPSIYGVVAKIFIKLPFLEVPSSPIELNDLGRLLNAALEDKNLLDIDTTINEKFLSGNNSIGNLEILIEAYLDE